MLIPLSWLKEFVDIKLPLKDLMWKMTEVGLTCESFSEVDNEIILDVEITPNRPDLMSVVGIAREVAAISNTKIKVASLPIPTSNIENPLRITIKPNYKIVPRISSVIIRNVTVKPSPEWLRKRIVQVGLRPINNLVDITNYVLWTYGSLLHVFDYDKIKGHLMNVESSKGGESFRSLDGLDYKLPKNAIIIKDSDRVIDLLPLKGGENTATYDDTKNVLLHSIICDPVITRRTSQSLKLRSDSSAIAERGLDPNGTLIAVNYALSLILKLAGGEVASKVIDHKAKNFPEWKLSLDLTRLENVLGIKIADSEVVKILDRLNLSPSKAGNKINCKIPTYRGDLKIEEDLIEEVARHYGYNKFPKTLPTGTVSASKVPYNFDSKFSLKLKELVVASGFSEAMTLALISKDFIQKSRLSAAFHIKLANPVSLEYEFMRSSLIPSLLSAVKINTQESLRLFSLDKVFLGQLSKTVEPFKLSSISRGIKFREFKGVVDLLLEKIGVIDYDVEFDTHQGFWHPFKAATITSNGLTIGEFGELHPEVLANFGIKEPLLGFELDVSTLEKHHLPKVYKPVPDFPPQIEDLTVVFPSRTRIGEVVKEISKTHKYINKVTLADIYKDAYTFRIWYQSSDKTLENIEIEPIRKTILMNLQKKFGGRVK